MRLEPIYLLAPESPPDVARRRLLVTAVGSTIAGIILGVGGTLALVVRGDRAEGASAEDDPDLRWATELSRGSLTRLLDQRVAFLVLVGERSPLPDVLWIGVTRLADAALNGHQSLDPEARKRLAVDLVAGTRGLDMPVAARETLRELTSATFR